MKVLTFEQFQGRTLTLFLYRNVKNADAILDQLKKGNLPSVSFIHPKWIMDEFQLYIAALKALFNQAHGCMSTRDVHTELVYVLASQHNITKSLLKFGISKGQTVVLIGFFGNDQDTDGVRNLIDGEEIENITFNGDEVEIKKHYKIDDKELALSSLSDSIVSRMVTRDL